MTTQQRLIDMNQQVDDQIKRIRNINRMANQNQQITNDTMKQLGDQGDTLRRHVQMNKNIKSQVNKADKKVGQMRRRNICTKLLMYIVIIILFILIMVLIINKLT